MVNAPPARAADAPREAPARVLVVDDQATQRLKLERAIAGLGHEVAVAGGGREAIERLARGDVELVVLDLVMPEVDGFDVLEHMRADEALARVPVIVVSALGDDLPSVVRAIEAGAEDFLPKHVERAVLRARLEASLEKARNRRADLAYLREVERLTRAALLLERGPVGPDALGLGPLVDREDALGRFARVFRDMARELHAHERRLERQLTTLRGGALLLAVGLVYGLSAPLARVAATAAPHPFGIALWVNLVGAALGLSIALRRGRLPRPSRALLRLLLIWAVLTTLLGKVLLYVAAERVPGASLSIVLVAEGFMVFAFAAFARLERASWRRLAGLAIGLVAVLLLLSGDADEGAHGPWMLVAFGVPLGFACREVYLAAHLPASLDPVAASALASLAGAALVLPFVIALDDFVAPSLALGPSGASLAAAVVGLGAIGVFGGAMRLKLLALAGPVFTSQCSFAIAIVGVVASVVLLGETPPLATWIALCLLLSGLALVGPKERVEPVPALPEGAGRLV